LKKQTQFTGVQNVAKQVQATTYGILMVGGGVKTNPIKANSKHVPSTSSGQALSAAE